MNLFTMRRSVAVAALAVASATLASPASAEAPDADITAAQICGDGVDLASADEPALAESGDEATAELYTYEVNAGIITTLCSFAIIETDEDSQLTGSYSLSATGADSVAGPVAGSVTVTQPLSSLQTQGAITLSAAGSYLTTDYKTVDVKVAKTAAQKKAAKKKYDKAVKKAKKAYAKAHKSSKAKKAMTKAIAKAKKAYKKAIKTTIVEREVEYTVSTPYALSATLTPAAPVATPEQ
jgi:hypothetical protein